MKKRWGIGLAVLLVVAVGLFSAWATSAAYSNVNIPPPTVAEMKITKLTDVNIDNGEWGAENRQKKTVNETIWKVTPPGPEQNGEFVMTAYYNGAEENVRALLLEFGMTYENASAVPTIYDEDGEQLITSSEDNVVWMGSDSWTQTSQADFENGVLENVDTTSSPGDVELAPAPGTVNDNFTDETKIAFKENVVVDTAAGQVKLSTSGGSETSFLSPNADGNYTQWTDVPAAGPHYQKVDDPVGSPDEDATLVGAGEDGYRDSYAFQDLNQPGATINSVKITVRIKKDRAKQHDNLCIFYRKAGTNYDNPTTIEPTTGYANYEWTYTTNPATGSAWTPSEIDGMEWGIKFVATNWGYFYVTQIYVTVNYVPVRYKPSGTLASTNLLSGKSVASINSFGYTASSIPSGTSLKVQFSQDNTNWYNSTGTLNGWDNLSSGAHTIDLSGLGWSGANFYYKMRFTSDGSNTPVLDEISVSYSGGGYCFSGTIASQVHDTGAAGTLWGSLSWSETIQAGTDITFEVRASDEPFAKDNAGPEWIPVGGTSPVTSGLPSGRYQQWRATLATENTFNTPILHEVTISYTTSSFYLSPPIGGRTFYIQPNNSGCFYVILKAVFWSTDSPPQGPGKIDLLLTGKALN